MAFRTERRTSSIKRELGRIIQRELDLDGALVTIISIDASEKIGRVSIGISVLPEDKAERVLYVLNKSTGFLKMQLNKKRNFRRVPRLVFSLSKGIENMRRVEELLEEMGDELEEEEK